MIKSSKVIASMFGLVTTMAEEMNFIRGRLQMMSYQGSFPQGVQPQVNLADPSGLIPVSDGENDGDDDSDDESISNIQKITFTQK